MQPVTTRMHARLARQLIAACGGLDEAVGACRLKRTRLSECQTPPTDEEGAPEPSFLPADVIADLEAYCGRPLYSQALAEARPAAPGLTDVVKGITDTTEEVADLQRLVRRLHAAGKRWSQHDRLQVTTTAMKIRDQLGAVMAIVDQDLQS